MSREPKKLALLRILQLLQNLAVKGIRLHTPTSLMSSNKGTGSQWNARP